MKSKDGDYIGCYKNDVPTFSRVGYSIVTDAEELKKARAIVDKANAAADAARKEPVASKQSEDAPSIHEKIQEALDAIDHENDDHWTKAGKVSVKYVEQFIGDTSIKAADVKAVAGDLTREKGDE